jgi:hypothetical protein
VGRPPKAPSSERSSSVELADAPKPSPGSGSGIERLEVKLAGIQQPSLTMV